jgi:hyperosmotically inducible protein
MEDKAMQKKSKLWPAVLAVSISAFTVPTFVQAQSSTPESPSTKSGVHSGSGSAPTSSTEKGTAGQVGKAVSDQATTEADRALNQRIRQALTADSALGSTTERVRLNTENGEVTLQGAVATEKEKTDIGAKVEQIAGVKKVHNQLQMAPSTGGAHSESMGSHPMGSSGSPTGSAADK